jgi:hypothetical protein
MWSAIISVVMAILKAIFGKSDETKAEETYRREMKDWMTGHRRLVNEMQTKGNTWRRHVAQYTGDPADPVGERLHAEYVGACQAVSDYYSREPTRVSN